MESGTQGLIPVLACTSLAAFRWFGGGSLDTSITSAARAGGLALLPSDNANYRLVRRAEIARGAGIGCSRARPCRPFGTIRREPRVGRRCPAATNKNSRRQAPDSSHKSRTGERSSPKRRQSAGSGLLPPREALS